MPNIQSRHCGLLSLANETLGEISSYLTRKPNDFSSFMTTCKRLDEVIAPVRYTSLTVEGPQGRHLLATLLSGSKTSIRYRLLVKRVWFRGYHDRELYLNVILLAELLQHTLNLIVLWMETSSLDNDRVVSRMRRFGVVRESLHPAFSIDDMTSDEGAMTPLTLPKLKYFRLSGSPKLLAVVHHRCIVELDVVNITMDHDEFATFVSTAEGTLLGDHLEILELRLATVVDIELANTVFSRAFPSYGLYLGAYV
ncbi:hypothetical protein DFP72DRAFT_1059079 [Ephemerocybe angulata]|uniref:Uncharacterized protein n=1 Tax=Ephemerocybe angulata TaxID=980116 RepID=A0A8H6MHF6_9AGAR|nr:hypothetical protein DFP72DRAFT_1059079 [Tulosesus angulatus]